MSNYRRLIPMLLCIAFFIINDGFNIDYPQAFQAKLIRKFGVKSSSIQNLYTIFAAVNLIFTPISGVIINRLGYGNSGLLFGSFGFLGMLLTYIGITNTSWNYLLVGRFIFSFSIEPGYILMATIINERFVGSFATLAITFIYTFCRLVGSFANIAMPELALRTRTLQYSFFVSAVVSSFPFLSSFVFLTFFQHRTQSEEAALHGEGVEDPNVVGPSRASIDKNKEPEKAISTYSQMDIEDEDIFTLSHFKTFKPLSICCILCYAFIPSVMYTMTGTITDLCQIRFGFKYADAKNMISLIQAVQIVALPLFGAVIQKIGYKPWFLVAGSLLSIGSVLGLISAPEEPSWIVYTSYVVFALYFSFYAPAIIPAIGMSLPNGAVSIAYSMGSVLQMGVLSVTPMVVGWLSNSRTPVSYQKCLWFMLGIGLIGLFFALGTILFDCAEQGILSMPENSEDVRQLRADKNEKFVRISRLRRRRKRIREKDKYSSLLTNAKEK